MMLSVVVGLMVGGRIEVRRTSARETRVASEESDPVKSYGIVGGGGGGGVPAIEDDGDFRPRDRSGRGRD
jgi:hypothetical protein